MKTGLLIVDAQENFVSNRALVDAIMIESTRHAHVIQTCFANKEDSLYRKHLDWHGDGGALVIENHAWHVLYKNGYGLSGDHIDFLRHLDVDAWHICGFETDACVLACAFSLWDANIRPVVRLELCASSTDVLHNHASSIIHRQFGFNY